LLPYGSVLMWIGLLLGVTATSMEVRRSNKAQQLADEFRSRGGQWS